MNKLTKLIVMGLGWIFVLIGSIGAFVPLLPTTPFLLLAAGCFSYASPKLKKWLHEHPKFGKILTQWEEERVIPLYAKVLSTTMMLTMVSYPLIFKPLNPWVKLSIVVTITLTLMYIWSKPSLTKAEQEQKKLQKLKKPFGA